MSKKPLPIINYPKLVLELPVSKQKIKYRPFVLREQQVLLLAKESGDKESIYECIVEVLTSCTDGSLDVRKTPLCDLSFLFLQMRIASIGPEMVVKTTCSKEDCGNEILMNLSLEDVKVSEVRNNKIMVTDDVGIIFRFPTYEDTLTLADYKNKPYHVIYHLVDSIFDAESVYAKADYTPEEFEDWVKGFDDKQVAALWEFSENIPDVYLDVNYHCPKCKEKYSKRLEGLHTFFRLSSR